jgi:DNA-directed RNA polymerase I, II, and III subunit RPABC2
MNPDNNKIDNDENEENDIESEATSVISDNEIKEKLGDDDEEIELDTEDEESIVIDDADEADENEEPDEEADEDEPNAEYEKDDLVNKDEMFEKGTKNQSSRNIEEEDEDEDDDDEDDEEYLQKFDENIRQNIIEDYHPELKQHNDDEVEALSKIVRSSDGTIIDAFHKTLPFLTKYEKARILGERAKQINAGAKPFINIENTLIDGYLIALRELEEKKIPFIIRRPLPHGGSEYWKLADLEILVG